MKKNCFARFAAAALSLAMLAGCGASQSSDSAAVDTGSADSAELTVFAAASMTETLNRIAEDYKAVAPNVTLTFNFASSGDLLTQIKEGADCDVFISAAPKQMNALDGSLKDDTDKNPDGLDEAALASSGVLTYGSNVKEVTTQVSEGAVDCGIIYATDAFSAGLDTVDEATADMCGQVIYPAAVLKNSTHADEAKAFLDYLTIDEAGKVFESVGFTTLA